MKKDVLINHGGKWDLSIGEEQIKVRKERMERNENLSKLSPHSREKNEMKWKKKLADEGPF